MRDNTIRAESKRMCKKCFIRYILVCSKDNTFILKTKERLCTAAQLEVMRSTRDTLLKYKESLEQNNNYLKDDIKKYTKGARCTFGFNCTQKCNFKKGITLEREI